MLRLKNFEEKEHQKLKDLFIQNNWEYHSKTQISEEKFNQLYQSDYFKGDEIELLLIMQQDDVISMIRLFDLGKDKADPETPLFDIRIASKNRNKGIGNWAVGEMLKHVFKNYPNKYRIEATTRIDNLRMRKVLEANLFIKEAHYRSCWPIEGATLKMDTIGYGLLKSDWLNRRVTPINWQA